MIHDDTEFSYMWHTLRAQIDGFKPLTMEQFALLTTRLG